MTVAFRINMICLLTLRRARKECDRVVRLYGIARASVLRGDLCGAGVAKEVANKLAVFALGDLAAAEPYMPNT